MSKKEKEEWFSKGLSFGCTQCGNCCTGLPGYVWFSDEELTEMAADKGVQRNDFLRLYAHRIRGRWSLNEQRNVEGDYDCVFLRRDDEGRGLCDIYKTRPTQCRTWPFWRENLSSRQAYEEAAEDCPGMEAGLEGGGTFFPVEKIRIMRDETPG